MQIIMPTLLFIGLTNIMGIQMLVPLGKEKYVLYSEIAGALIDLVLNALLIPRYGAAGAAVGTLVAEVVVWIVQFKYLKNDIIPIFKTIRYPLILLAAVISAAVAGLTKILDWHPFFILVVSAILYFGIYFLVLIIGKEELILELKDKFLGRIVRKCKRKKD